jgi:hypothetical protein
MRSVAWVRAGRGAARQVRWPVAGEQVGRGGSTPTGATLSNGPKRENDETAACGGRTESVERGDRDPSCGEGRTHGRLAGRVVHPGRTSLGARFYARIRTPSKGQSAGERFSSAAPPTRSSSRKGARRPRHRGSRGPLQASRGARQGPEGTGAAGTGYAAFLPHRARLRDRTSQPCDAIRGCVEATTSTPLRRRHGVDIAEALRGTPVTGKTVAKRCEPGARLTPRPVLPKRSALAAPAASARIGGSHTTNSRPPL